MTLPAFAPGQDADGSAIAVAPHEVVQLFGLARRGNNPIARLQGRYGEGAAEAAGRTGDEPSLSSHAVSKTSLRY